MNAAVALLFNEQLLIMYLDSQLLRNGMSTYVLYYNGIQKRCIEYNFYQGIVVLV